MDADDIVVTPVLGVCWDAAILYNDVGPDDDEEEEDDEEDC